MKSSILNLQSSIKDWKKITKIFLFLGIMIFANTKKSFSQPYNKEPFYSINSELRSLLSPLNNPYQHEFLFDMSVHTIDSLKYLSNANDTLEDGDWLRIYDEFFYASYDTTSKIGSDTIFERAMNTMQEAIPICIMSYDYSKFVADGITSANYFVFDTINNTLTDIVNRPNEPYYGEKLFASAPFVHSSINNEIDFRVEPRYLFADVINYQNLCRNDQLIKIDFGDGNGWQNVDATIINDFHVVYPDSGVYTINTGLFDLFGVVQRISAANFVVVQPVSSTSEGFDSTFVMDGIIGGLKKSCTASKKKAIIYLEGIDLADAFNSYDRNALDIYNSQIKGDNHLSDLRNFDYDFWVINWENSRRCIEDNGKDLVGFINLLKEYYQKSDEPFVLIGESMGGLVGKYALMYMESENYTRDGKAYKPDLMHKTRLFITLDTPHKGANIPIGAQWLYEEGLSFFPTSKLSLRTAFWIFKNGLAAPAVKQMLLYHIYSSYSSPSIGYYEPHQKYYELLEKFDDMGRVPKYCKNIAVSNGALSGAKQKDDYAKTIDKIAGDNMLNHESTLDVRIFGKQLRLLETKLLVNYNPDGFGTVYRADYKTFIYIPKIKWFKITFQQVNGISNQIIKSANNVLPYCVSSGGEYNSFFAGNFIDIFADPTSSLTPNLFVRETSVNPGKRFGVDIFSRVISHGFDFGFIPTFSALDYTLNMGLNFNFLNQNATYHTTKTPFDLIMGDVKFNRAHLYVKNELIRDNLNLNLQIQIETCINQPHELYKYILNQEIGDEHFYIGPYRVGFNQSIQSERNMNFGVVSPYYDYHGLGFNSQWWQKGTYSKIPIVNCSLLGFANLQYGQNFSSTYTVGNQFAFSQQTMPICCFDYKTQGRFSHQSPLDFLPSTENLNRNNSLNIFPNPSQSGSFTLENNFTDSNFSIEIYDIIGRKQNFSSSKLKQYQLGIELQNKSAGIYFIHLKNNNNQEEVYKLILN